MDDERQASREFLILLRAFLFLSPLQFAKRVWATRNHVIPVTLRDSYLLIKIDA